MITYRWITDHLAFMLKGSRLKAQGSGQNDRLTLPLLEPCALRREPYAMYPAPAIRGWNTLRIGRTIRCPESPYTTQMSSQVPASAKIQA